MSAVVNGSNAATFNKETISFSPNSSGEYGGRYQGPKAAVKAKMDELIATGWAVRYVCDSSPLATLEFSTPSAGTAPPSDPNADYTDHFQLIRNSTSKEMLMSDHPLVAAVSSSNLKALKKLFANPSAAQYLSGDIEDTLTGGTAEQAQKLFDMFESGVRSIDVQQPVLRKTRLTNPLYDAPFDVGNVDRVLSTVAMIGDSGVPSNFAVPLLELAARLSARTPLDGDGYAVRADKLKLKFGWLKSGFSKETVGRTRNQYLLEWQFGLWDTDIFGDVV